MDLIRGFYTSMFTRAQLQTAAFGIPFAFAFGAGAPAFASGTPAGTSIDNVATATWNSSGGTQSITSNLVKLRVDELLGVVVASGDPGPVPASNGDVGRVLKFQVTNAGNGAEAFALATQSAVGGDDFDPTPTAVVVDTNGNGAYDAGVDVAHIAGVNDPVLAPDASVTVFVISSMPAAAADGARGFMRLVATAATGSGAPGTLIPGLGQGGGDAVVGATTARAQADGSFVLASVAVAFVKAAVVLDPFGGTRALPGSIVTYSLVATLSGTGTLTNLALSDTIPAGTAYQPGTLALDGAALTDAADARRRPVFSQRRLGHASSGGGGERPRRQLQSQDQLRTNVMRLALLPLLAALATPAIAADNVTLKSDVFVARIVKDAAGRTSAVLQPPTLVTPGDKLVFVLNYKNEGNAPATGFTVTNPIPAAVVYADQASAGEVVSVDKGRSWGTLDTLRVRTADGKIRPAAASDVTHIRWTLKAPVAAGAGGTLQFNGIVR